MADNEHDEAAFVAHEVDRLTDDGDARPGDVAVFYRTNAQSRVFEEVFIRVGMPYKVVGGVRFYERKEIRDALAYLRCLANPEDTVSLRRILNVPKRGIGDRAEACVEAYASRERISFWQALRVPEDVPGMATRSINAVREFVTLLDELRAAAETLTPADLITEVLKTSGYLEELQASRDPQDETRVENLQELEAVAREFEERLDGESAEGRLPEFLEQVALVADADSIPGGAKGGPVPPGEQPEETDQGVVTLMTLHTAKGLEFPVVFLTGMEDGVFPSPARHEQPQGTRRGTPPRLRRHHPRPAAPLRLPRHDAQLLGRTAGQPPSRFLGEVPTTLLEWEREASSTSTPAMSRMAARPGTRSRETAPSRPFPQATRSPTTPSAWAPSSPSTTEAKRPA